MKKILISSCLLGMPVRYDGLSKPIIHPMLELWKQQQRLISVCPELAGGLPVPRPAAEVLAGKVLTQSGEDVTLQFEQGAGVALALCKKHHIEYALLKESSPSCGRNNVYDGSHKGFKIDGMGITAKRLSDNGIQVFSELQIDQLAAALVK